MDPEIRSFAEIEQFIKEHPKEADALAAEWQKFINTYVRENPEILDIRSREEFLAWATQHPEKHIDTSIWIGKEITEYSYLKRQQEEKNKTTADEKQSQKKPFGEQRAEPYATKDFSAKQSFEKEQEERDREQRPSISTRDIKRIIKSAEQPQATIPRAAYQPKAPTQAGEFFRGSARLGGRVAGRTGSMAGRLASRLAAQAGVAVGRAAASGVAAAAGNPVGLIVIGVIILIIIIVFLIIMFAGGGGIGGGAPTVDCADADGKPIVVFDGNECAVNTAAYYSNLTGTPTTATCVDKCTDTVSVLCDRNATNNCTSPDASCGTMQTFCIQYSPPPLPSDAWLYDCNSAVFDYTFFASCNAPTPTPTPAGFPTPTPNLLGISEKSFVLLRSSVNQTGILEEPKEGVKLSVEEILEAETDSGWVYVAKTISDLNNVTFWFSITKIQNNVGLVYGIADIKNNNYYSGLLPGGEIEAGKFGDNYGIIYYDFDNSGKYKAAEVRQINALGTIELNVNLPWPSLINPTQKYVYSNTLPLTGYPIWESGDGVIPLNSDTLSWYLSFIFENGVWMDIQKFNVKALANFGPRAANHRWGAFILEKAGGGLPADTVGVWWEILDGSNNRQAGGFTNFDMKKGGLRFTLLQDRSEDFQIIPIETYNSGNKVYLRKWKFVDSGLGVDLLMETNIANQENQVLGNYFYEGGIKVFHPGGSEIGTGMYEATHSE